MKIVGIIHFFDFFIVLLPDSYCNLCLRIEGYSYCVRNSSDQEKNFRNKLEGNERITAHYAITTLVDYCCTVSFGAS